MEISLEFHGIKFEAKSIRSKLEICREFNKWFEQNPSFFQQNCDCEIQVESTSHEKDLLLENEK